MSSLCRASPGLKNVMALLNTRFIATSQESFAAKNSKTKANKAKKNGTQTTKVEEKPIIPTDQNAFDEYIANYRNEDYYKYNDYSYYDYETEMLASRQPQPRKPSPY